MNPKTKTGIPETNHKKAERGGEKPAGSLRESAPFHSAAIPVVAESAPFHSAAAPVAFPSVAPASAGNGVPDRAAAPAPAGKAALAGLFQNEFYLGKTPAVLYGASAEKAFLYVHGQGGNKEEAARFYQLAAPFGYAVLSVSLPEHGGRKDDAKFLPWQVVPELQAAFAFLSARYASVSVRATSIGAYFSLLAFPHEKIEKCLFVSPLFDMENMIAGRMAACGVSEERLENEREIPTPFGQALSWDYLTYARSHPVRALSDETEILCASADEIVPHVTVAKFAKENGCGIVTFPGGQHYFHKRQDVCFMEWWERSVLGGRGVFVAETDRLTLRRMTEQDFPALCRILQDGQTMAAYEGAFSDEEAKGWLARQLERYRKWEFGLWAVTLKETGEMIGQCGLTMQPWKGREVLEIGYLFERRYWHRGYATEAATACKRFAREVLKADEVCCIIRDTNLSSQKVAERLSMQKTDREVRYYRGVAMPHDRYVWRCDRDDRPEQRKEGDRPSFL